MKYQKISFSHISLPNEEVTQLYMQELAKFMAIETDKILMNGLGSSYSTYSEVKPPTLDMDGINKAMRMLSPVVRFEHRMTQALLETLRNAGLHPENLEKIEWVCSTSVGKEALRQLTYEQLKDTEWLTQHFLNIYKVIENER